MFYLKYDWIKITIHKILILIIKICDGWCFYCYGKFYDLKHFVPDITNKIDNFKF